MQSKYFLVLFSALGLMLGAQSALAASATVREMASIVAHLNHYPSDGEKARLRVIAADKGSTEPERVIATAIANLEHTVTAADADKLRKVSGDMSAPAEVRELAGIVLNIQHQASAADKRKLETMMK